MSIDEIINQHQEFAHEATKRENKIAFVDQMRTIIQAYNNEEISLSKVCEIINCGYLAKRKSDTAVMAVAFAEWKDGEKISKPIDGNYYYQNKWYSAADLYKYWIENIYNK